MTMALCSFRPLCRARSRPVDPASDVRNKLVDGAWAGRFAHRFKTYHDPDKTLLDRVKADLHKLGELYRKYPEIR